MHSDLPFCQILRLWRTGAPTPSLRPTERNCPLMPKSKKQKLSSKEESNIWFHLYDYGTGKPYKGTTAEKVSLPPGSDITDFRKAVKVKCSNTLSSIDANKLLVFQNKQSFDKRDSTVEKVIY